MTQLSHREEPELEHRGFVYKEEQEKLEEVLKAIRERTDSIDDRLHPAAAYSWIAREIQDVLVKSRDTLESALDQPYFGRVDYLASNETRTIYIGTAHVPDTNVYSWTVPVARLWYTNDNWYMAPGGEIRVRVDLKRYIRIRRQQLVEFNDIYKRALPAATSSPEVSENPALTAALSASGTGGQLQVIVETIEPDQYESIANVSDRALVVQGAAGSGKSEIGMHRIAYLLSPFNDVPERERPTPNTTLFVGPSASFLEYVSDLLPQLGVQEKVQQITLRDWLGNHHSARLNIRARIWNNLLDKGQLTRFNERAEAFKGSMAMTDVLDRYVKNLLDRYRSRGRNVPPLTVAHDERNRVNVGRNDVQAVLNTSLFGADDSPRLNIRRQEFANRITSMIWERSGLGSTVRGEAVAQQQRRIETESVNPWLNSWWPNLDFRQEYVTLLSNPEMLASLAKGAIREDSAKALQESLQQASTDGFEDSDIGALTYMDHLLNGTFSRRYRHIVVDEAQDISPIEFRLLQLSSVNNWFTILGDTVQRLAPYRGIRRWRDLERVLGRSALKVQHARTSYRSNQHITRFNNRILRLFDKYIDAPIPYGREGHRVEYHRHNDSEEMYRDVAQQLERIREMEGLADARIALLARDRNNLNQFRKFCENNGVEEVVLFGEESLSSKTVLARIPDTKGLEYDAVIVIGVNDSFASTTFNQKLLYIAASRAKHYLAMHWSGKQSSILREIYSGGVTFFDHTRTSSRSWPSSTRRTR